MTPEELNDVIDRLEAGLRAVLEEHKEVRASGRSYCLVCGPGDGYFPCVTVAEARAALGDGQ